MPVLHEQVEILSAASKNPAEFRERLDAKITGLCRNMPAKASTYYCGIDIQIGWSLTLLTDPLLAPHIAKPWLDGLLTLGLIGTDVYTPFTFPADEPSNEASWTIHSTEYAYPDMTKAMLRSKVYDSVVRDKSKALAHANKLALLHPRVVAELIILANDGLRLALVTTDWRPGDSVSRYFRDVMQPLVPVLSDGLEKVFGSCSDTSTCVECGFAVSNQVIDPSMSTRKISDLSGHQSAARTNLVGKMDVKVQHRDGTCSKLHNVCSTAPGRRQYIDLLNALASQLKNVMGCTGKTVSQMQKEGGKNADIANLQPSLADLLNLQKRKAAFDLTGDKASKKIDQVNEGKAIGDEHLLEDAEDILLKNAKTIKSAESVLLIMKYNPDGRTAEMLSKLPKRLSEEKESLEGILITILRQYPDLHLRNRDKFLLALL